MLDTSLPCGTMRYDKYFFGESDQRLLPVRVSLLAEILHQVDKTDELWAKLS